ncbi:hypothetical protein [Desulforamulus hydrothermalis]|uniref:Uncharacterized protein n=1 Tax=Desulforamulus hydrothermalis Lam5 = DSM 18033 TaxID=1121428 RepID=K8EBW6_9FIRM|nr:hypothetical protein [Desulforamulus hydrothermalis]CCO09193.1 conserved hypothetical hypothetical protein [Desulforamulus hydrothermalis Lam5 = DSM 18033]SHH10937.1 hypothetical protein SAMN02745177_01458 [Desulforamulus hydrothermalis Lam5 = DSM 18033]
MTKVALIRQCSLHPLSLLDRLAKNFMQEDFILLQDYHNLDILLNRMAALGRRADGSRRPVLSVYAGGDCVFINTLKDSSSLGPQVAPEAEPSRALLEQEVLGGILNLSPQDRSATVTYTQDPAAALKAVEDGQYQLAVLLA